jgi:ABC-type lipoprotein release transport system permease subunit
VLIFEIIMVAMAAVRANVLRSVLTTLGIIIGVAAVIAMVALGEGAQQRVEQQIERMGTNVLTIRPGQQMWGGVSRGESNMSVDDAEALRDGSNGLMKISPEISSRMQVTYLRWNSNTQIQGVWPEYFEMYDHALQFGRGAGTPQGRGPWIQPPGDPGRTGSGGAGGSDHPDSWGALRGHRGVGGEGGCGLGPPR